MRFPPERRERLRASALVYRESDEHSLRVGQSSVRRWIFRVRVEFEFQGLVSHARSTIASRCNECYSILHKQWYEEIGRPACTEDKKVDTVVRHFLRLI